MATRIDKSSNKFVPRIGPRVRARNSQSVAKSTSTDLQEQSTSQDESGSHSQLEQNVTSNGVAHDLPPSSLAPDQPPRSSLAPEHPAPSILPPGTSNLDTTPSRIRQATPSTLKRQGRPFDSPAVKRSGTAFAAPTAALTPVTTLQKSAVTTDTNGADSISSPSRPIKRPRTSSATPAEGDKPSRKRRMPKWEDDPEEEPVDFAEVTMAEICKDLGKGRKSARYKELEKDKAEKRKEARKLAKERRLAAAAAQGADHDNENQGTANGQARTSSRRGNAISVPIDPALAGDADTSTTTAASAQEPEEEREETPERVLLKESMYAPQLRLVNGNLVLDEDSLVVDRTAEAASHNDGPITTVIESAATRYVNSASYSKKERSERWNDDETKLFFNGLSIWGTDFELIARMIPGRSRRQVKNKFNREERRDPSKITEALKSRKKLDIAEYADAVGVSFREDVDPTEFDLPPQAIGENGQRTALDERSAAAREIAQAVVGTGKSATAGSAASITAVPATTEVTDSASIADAPDRSNVNTQEETEQEATSSAGLAPTVAPAVQVGRGKKSARPSSQRLGRLRAAAPRAVSKS